MKTQKMNTERIYKGRVTNISIKFVGSSDLKHYTISFATGDIHLYTKGNPGIIGLTIGDIISFTTTYIAGQYIASNLKKLEDPNKTLKPRISWERRREMEYLNK